MDKFKKSINNWNDDGSFYSYMMFGLGLKNSLGT